MASKRYPPEIIANAKQLIIYEGWSPRKVSDFFGEQGPHWATVQNWASETDEAGKTWYDLREDYVDSVVNQITPQEIERLYMKRIYETLSDPKFGQGHSDALRKLMKDFREITDPGRQIPVVYAFLTELIDFMKKYYDDIVTKRFLEAIRDYKNHQRNKLQS